MAARNERRRKKRRATRLSFFRSLSFFSAKSSTWLCQNSKEGDKIGRKKRKMTKRGSGLWGFILFRPFSFFSANPHPGFNVCSCFFALFCGNQNFQPQRGTRRHKKVRAFLRVFSRLYVAIKIPCHEEAQEGTKNRGTFLCPFAPFCGDQDS